MQGTGCRMPDTQDAGCMMQDNAESYRIFIYHHKSPGTFLGTSKS